MSDSVGTILTGLPNRDNEDVSALASYRRITYIVNDKKFLALLLIWEKQEFDEKEAGSHV
jgi:hypothetical protein